jgi:2,3,4,5-tetrahydropyridine-2-carboxylate N-succinyltransferase
MQNIKTIIEQAWEKREMLQQKEVQQTIEDVIDLLDQGKLRVAKRRTLGGE